MPKDSVLPECVPASAFDQSSIITNPPEALRKSRVYQHYLAERNEILRHKWLESQKVGHDIGFARAHLDWIRHHRTEWRTKRRGLLFKAS